ncbi:hypothetical protein F2Q69_00047287 [Brassica cretica]|uniref:Uncharacterized protein n=1 Tax=Brassica cretica TaxID=69181 RepID=A0A8S9PWB1_BRACR|nr:hypothetical protein F2Q69_00047287 [Brassica cretica]
MVLIFHSFKGFSDLEDFWDDLPVSRLKYNALDDFQEVFQTTSWKSDKSPFHNRSDRFGGGGWLPAPTIVCILDDVEKNSR